MQTASLLFPYTSGVEKVALIWVETPLVLLTN